MSVKSKLNYSLKQVLNRDNLGSYATRHDRQYILSKFTSDLLKLGYKLPDIRNLKQKHIIAVTQHWQGQGLSNSTLKNRISAIRHLATLMSRNELVPSNQSLNIGARRYTPIENRAQTNIDLAKVKQTHIRVSLELQRVFGLRREESLKIKPHIADKGRCLELQPSWCKGGRGRFVPIRTEEQRYWLNQAKEIVGRPGHSLIPQETSYIKHRYVYDKQVSRAGFHNLHGLRHAYAQQRYKDLTGWETPINGGPKSHELTSAQKELDYQARMILTEELGHSREQITVNYLGR